MRKPQVYIDYQLHEGGFHRYDLESMQPGEYIIIGRQPNSGSLMNKVRELPRDVGRPYVPWETIERGGIQIIDSTVSLGHAVIVRGMVGALQQEYWLFDLGSTNGTWVNTHQIENRSPVMLHKHAVIGLGENLETLRFWKK